MIAMAVGNIEFISMQDNDLSIIGVVNAISFLLLNVVIMV